MGLRNRAKVSKGQAAGEDSLITSPSNQELPPRNQQPFNWNQVIEWGGIAIASALAFWFLIARLAAVTVSVLIDEYVYVLDAHYKAFTESTHPNHLFQLVYRATKSCGPDFYECAREINALFVVASAAVIYLLTFHLTKNRWLGALAWSITILGTFATYTAYFMPEAIFNFFMVLFVYGLVRFGNSDRFLVWLGLGFVLGIASLAKPHALFVVPALLIYIFLAVWSTKQSPFRSSAFRLSPFLGSLALTKLGFGYLIAGQNGLSLFGSYGSALSSGEAVSQTLGANTWLNVPETALGQTLMIVMILGVALPVALVGFLRVLRKDPELFAANRFRALFGIALLNMMAVSALFEAWLNLNTWMHTRYYSYLIPLAILVLFEAYSQRELERTNIAKRIVVGVFVAISVYALFTQGIPFGANWIDAPDFLAHIRNVEISSTLIVFAIAISIFWIWNSKASMALAIAVSVFASGFAGWHTTIFLNEAFGKTDSFQQVGRLLSNYLPQQELDKTVIFGTDAVAMQRTLFYSLSGGATAIGGTHAEYDKAEVDPATRWILVYGEPLPQLGQPHLTGIGYQLYSLIGDTGSPPRTSELKEYSNPCADSANSGWVCGAETALSVNESFPANAKVDLVFDVGDALVGKEIEFSLGDSRGVVTAPAGRFALSVSFQNTSEAQHLLIASKDPNLGTAVYIEQMIRVVSVNVE